MLIQIYQILKNQLKEWQFSYNYQRLHGSLNGKTPAQYSGELGDKTPLWGDVIAAYNLSKERIQGKRSGNPPLLFNSF